MSGRSRLPAVPRAVALHTHRLFRSLLIPLDLSPVSDRVVGRVALFPLAERARLSLLHVVPKTLPLGARRRAEADAKRALEAEAESLASRLPKNVHIEPVVKVGAPAAEIVRHAAAAKVELIVMGRGGGQGFRDVLLGSTAERVIRRGQSPVLVVRLPPRGPYRRPALAIDLDQAAHGILDLLLRVIPPPRPSVEVLHAYDVPFAGIVYPSLPDEDAEEYREHYRRKALHELAKVLAKSLAEAKVASSDAPSLSTHVRYGSPRAVIKRAVKRGDTDLLVLGTHGYTGVAHAFLGTVAGDVLRDVTCDVLVVPPRRYPSRTA